MTCLHNEPRCDCGRSACPECGRVIEREVAHYDPRPNNYDLTLDPRCLFGWGPGDVAGCHCMFGHACFRYLGHPGMCWDAGEKRQGDPPCHQRKRPKDWDEKGRAEANK